MESYHIKGGAVLEGEYRVKGAKNSALPILAATVCKAGIHEIHGCPNIGDVRAMEKILTAMGAKTKWEGDCIIVDTGAIDNCHVNREMMAEMRSSVFLLGSLLAGLGEATVYRPGGCKIGERPIDIHINGLAQLGFEIETDCEKITCRGVCRGGEITLPYPSVGATENLMMAALSGTGDTIIKNCAEEPEIVDLQGFLRSCGYQVYGAGTDTIYIKGGKGTNDAMYFIMEDRIEASTYLMAAGATAGKVTLTNIRPEFIKSVIDAACSMGIKIKSYEDRIYVEGTRHLKSPGIITTRPYPGFPTDCQPQLLTLACAAQGTTTIREEIFDSRFTHKKELIKMGANIETCGKNAIIKGTDRLVGTQVEALDLRGGAALVLAGLFAWGETVINGIHHIERGYQDLDLGLSLLGGKIEKRSTREEEKTETFTSAI